MDHLRLEGATVLSVSERYETIVMKVSFESLTNLFFLSLYSFLGWLEQEEAEGPCTIPYFYFRPRLPSQWQGACDSVELYL
jgi:hypothetical protein